MIISASTEKVLGNNEEAIKQYQELLDVFPKTALAYFELSELHVRKNEYDKAITYAGEAYRLAPENEWYTANLAGLYLHNQQYNESLKIYEELDESYPEGGRYLYFIAENYLYLNDFDKALDTYNEVEERNGVSEDLSLYKNNLYLQLGKTDEAIDELKKLIKINPDELKYIGILAEVYEELGEDEKALELYEEILERDPNNGTVRISLYGYYKYHGQKDKAREQLKLAFGNKNVSPEIKSQILSEYFVNSERNETLKSEAYDLLDIMIATHPNHPAGFAFYGDFLARDLKDDRAAEMLEKVVELDPSQFNSWYQLMMIYSVNDKSEKLAERSKAAIELYPNQPTFYYFNGVANIILKNYSAAAKVLETGKDFVIDNPELKVDFYQYLGDSYHALEEYEKSDSYYDKVLALNPNNIYVLNNYSYYLSLRKEKLDKAEEMAAKANELIPMNATYQDTYGWVLYQKADYNGAEEWLKKALDNGGDSSGEVLEHYGDTQFKLGNSDTAIEYWKKAKEAGGYSDDLDQKISTGKLSGE